HRAEALADEGGGLVVAEQDDDGAGGGAAFGEGQRRGQRVVERLAELVAHPVAVAPDDVRRVAGGGEGVEDPAVAERVPREERRDRRPGRVRGDEGNLGEDGGAGVG